MDEKHPLFVAYEQAEAAKRRALETRGAYHRGKFRETLKKHADEVRSRLAEYSDVIENPR